MRLNDPGRTALRLSLIAWAVGAGFLILSWLTVALLYRDLGADQSQSPEGYLLLIFPMLSALSVPMALVAIVLGVVGSVRGPSRGRSVLAIVLCLPILLVAAMGVFALSMGGV